MDFEYINTNSIEDVANDIIALKSEYVAQINKLFNRLNQVPNSTGEWIGEQAEKYTRLVMLEKEDYLKLAFDLNNYARLLKKYAIECEDVINKNLTLERNV